MNSFQDYLSAAVDAVLSFDVPEADFAKAVQAQACLMAGVHPDEILWHYE